MASIQHLQTAATALTEKAIGLTREVVGTFINNDSLKRAGQAQQRKATERLEAAEQELKADKERAVAVAKEKQQGRYQDPDDRQSSSGLGRGGAAEAAGAAAEKVKGTLKSVAGSVTGNENLRKEGDVQQDKADAKGRIAKREGEAEAARAKAKLAEAEQRAAEN